MGRTNEEGCARGGGIAGLGSQQWCEVGSQSQRLVPLGEMEGSDFSLNGAILVACWKSPVGPVCEWMTRRAALWSADGDVARGDRKKVRFRVSFKDGTLGLPRWRGLLSA